MSRGTGSSSRRRHGETMGEAEPPILYSFRRCPYAIRARLALLATGLPVELREVDLRAKPPELLEVSPRATVPVLVLPPSPGGSEDRPVAIDESVAIMRWALAQRPAAPWWGRTRAGTSVASASEQEELIACNDGPFKHHLDRFKYAGRYPDEDVSGHREAALVILREWNRRLERWRAPRGGDGRSLPPGALLGPEPCLVDWALLPFVRQFRLADPQGFDAEPGLEALRGWLRHFLDSPQLATVMAAPLAARRPWRSPRWIYHIALREEWRASEPEGTYRRSTRGRGLEEVGFIHAALPHQLQGVHRRFHADAGPTVLLTIDPRRLQEAGIAVVEEVSPGESERFPHILGPLPRHTVLRVEPWPVRGSG